METTVLDWLASVGSAAFRWSAVAFVILNGVAVAALFLTKDRALVNRWTGRVLAANLVLVGTGVGVPLIAAASRLAISVVTPARAGMMPVVGPEERPLVPAVDRSKDD
jgi:zinc transporter ZupT